MKHYIKPIIGSIVIVAAFAFGAILARPVDALADLTTQEDKLELQATDILGKLRDVRKQKCALIVSFGGECAPDADFGKTLEAAMQDFR